MMNDLMCHCVKYIFFGIYSIASISICQNLNNNEIAEAFIGNQPSLFTYYQIQIANKHNNRIPNMEMG